MPDYKYLIYESLDDGKIARIYLNRPETRNAQHFSMLKELNEAFMAAEADETVRVVILGGVGKSFSSGHDFASAEARADREKFTTSYKGVEARWRREWEMFFTYNKRWRDLRKITIAQAQGPVINGGVTVMWVCDLICAADNAIFADTVGAKVGMCGLEYFAHPWELGVRKAKELMLTGDYISANEAANLGMVNKVFPAASLEAETLDFARRIARMPSMTALAIKESCNQTQDIQGFSNALGASFSLHQMNHGYWAEVTNGASSMGTPEYGVPGTADWKNAPGLREAEKSSTGFVESSRYI